MSNETRPRRRPQRSGMRLVPRLQKQPGNNRRLRKQPRMQRLEAATTIPMPQMAVPDHARQRRKRNRRQKWQLPTTSVKQVIGSSRWLSVALLSVCLYAIYFIGMQEAFYLTYIPVEGVSSIAPSEIVEASGLAGAHVFSVNPSDSASAIHDMPGVVSATVTLSWPNNVNIKIVEDTPIAVWTQAGETFWLTSSGSVMPARKELPGLLVIEGKTAKPLATPDPELSAEENAALFEGPYVADEVLAGALQLRELRPDISKLYFEPDGGLSFEDSRGWRVYFGVGTDMAQKLVVYEAIIANLEAQGLTPLYVSVANQEKPFYQAFGP